MLDRKKTLVYMLLLLAAVSLLVAAFIDPIAQDPSYHRFSDSKTILGIPNALNVLSNLPLLIVGAIGLNRLRALRSDSIVTENKAGYLILFFSVVLVAIGSSFYHLWPMNSTLLWDRLPMTLAFMSLFSIITSEFISVRWGRYLLVPLLILGLLSVSYWYFTELAGVGDLRWYGLIQFYPVLAIPPTLLLSSSPFSKTDAYWWLFATYLLAKVFEHYDYFIHSMLTVISGHSLKHIAAAAGLYVLLVAYERRHRYKTTHAA